ncbi:response regulator [Catenuloplanes indicus]|uniref:CheY-like chemotaxis protein n=1 Tax=Catenuloplanes indicus TaxID=137267 RepID=A0AAE3W5E4_9ACTN|nr:response regulator [Catenuloplanes indicus]MDQ0369761.1 CheY-like chemotaxis protein [Catenuloplanes indicus]
MLTQRILMVDDEQRILDAFRRSLHGRYELDTANSGADGLAKVHGTAYPYAVVVSDMRMPGMNGAEFLAGVRERSPDTVQIILSGQADLGDTIAAVNDGNLFRFLTKPCEPAELARALDAALAQHRLIMSERELLERTLDGAVKVLTELMAAAHPVAAARTETVRTLIDACVSGLRPKDTWELRLAAMLGQVGMMAVPPEVIARATDTTDVDAEALAMFRGHPQLSRELIGRIPRLERVAAWVASQPVTLAEAQVPTPRATEESGGAAKQIYETVTAFVVAVESGLAPGAAVVELARNPRYPAEMLDAAVRAYSANEVRRPRQVKGKELVVGMLMNQDVVTKTGMTLVRAGEVLTESHAIRLRHFAEGVGVVEPISVLA